MSAMTEREKAADLERRAPALRAEDLEKVNGLFRAYLFRGAGGQVWTTCCRRHETIPKDSDNADALRILYAPHAPEKKYYWQHNAAAERREKCPWCGREVTVKELRYSGRRKNLWEYQRAVVLRRWHGAVWATAWDCEKSYTGEDRQTGEPLLTALPTVKLMGVYRFAPKKAESATRAYWWDDSGLTAYTAQSDVGKSRRMWNIHGPYGYCADLGGKGYDVIGWRELAGSFMGYCGLDLVKVSTDRQIELLTAACFYPRQIEWLVKSGLDEAVADLAGRGVKHAEAICWEATTPKGFIGCAPKELAALRDAAPHYPLEALELYRKCGKRAAPADCGRLAWHLDDTALRRKVLKRMKQWGVSVAHMADYLDAVKAGNKRANPARAYADYLDAAEGCGLDMDNPVIRMPRDFWRKHDEITRAWSVLRDRQRNKEKSAKYRKRMAELTKKYLYWDDTYLIRAPISAGEIVAEGKALKHCVGGYADRHINGQTTILLLRRRDRPHVPLTTIEIRGDKIIQVHGFRNELEPCDENPERISAQELYGIILDPWLKWVKRGSPRDEQGRPKKTKKKGKEKAA